MQITFFFVQFAIFLKSQILVMHLNQKKYYLYTLACILSGSLILYYDIIEQSILRHIRVDPVYALILVIICIGLVYFKRHVLRDLVPDPNNAIAIPMLIISFILLVL